MIAEAFERGRAGRQTPVAAKDSRFHFFSGFASRAICSPCFELGNSWPQHLVELKSNKLGKEFLAGRLLESWSERIRDDAACPRLRIESVANPKGPFRFRRREEEHFCVQELFAACSPKVRGLIIASFHAKGALRADSLGFAV